jgi:hypothetical protein
VATAPAHAGGWFITPNVLAKAEYVNQKYFGYAGVFPVVALLLAILFRRTTPVVPMLAEDSFGSPAPDRF